MDRRYYKYNIKREINNKVKRVTRDDILDAFDNSRGDNLQVLCLDSIYRAIPIDVWELIVGRSRLDRRSYKPNFFDCDDFAKIFWAMCSKQFEINGCGFVADFSGGHAYNVLLVVEPDRSLDLAWLEPQTDLIMDKSPATGYYQMKNGLVMI